MIEISVPASGFRFSIPDGLAAVVAASFAFPDRPDVKHKVFEVLEVIGALLSVILSIATGLGDLALIVWLFQNNYTFWGIVAIILGISIVTVAGELLSLPFIGITAGFSNWYDESEYR